MYKLSFPGTSSTITLISSIHQQCFYPAPAPPSCFLQHSLNNRSKPRLHCSKLFSITRPINLGLFRDDIIGFTGIGIPLISFIFKSVITDPRLQFVVEPRYRRPNIQQGENIKVLFAMVVFSLSILLTNLVLNPWLRFFILSLVTVIFSLSMLLTELFLKLYLFLVINLSVMFISPLSISPTERVLKLRFIFCIMSFIMVLFLFPIILTK